MNMYLKTAIVALIACVVIAALKETKKEYAAYLALLCGVCVIASGISDLRYIKTALDGLTELSELNLSALKIFFKAVGITVISSITSDACIDGGNRFLAFCVELSGKIAVTVSALPLISSVIKIIAGYIGT